MGPLPVSHFVSFQYLWIKSHLGVLQSSEGEESDLVLIFKRILRAKGAQRVASFHLVIKTLFIHEEKNVVFS